MTIDRKHLIIERVTITDSGCWEWCLSRDTNGYGMCSRNVYGEGLAHRLAWVIFNGPTNLNVLHKCDNPPCCNPEHLFLGTQMDNLQDMRKKGRAKLGRTIGPRYLSWERLAELKGLSKEGWSQRQLASKFLISQATVGNYLRGNYETD